VQAGQPSDTARWLAHSAVADHHHLRDGHPEDMARLARMVTGTGYGLVLGGGGPRGFAHLGVLRALEEAGVPIDVVGGTSIGALMGAISALGMDDAERVARAVTAFTRSGRLVSPTLPLVALSSGRRVDRLLAEHLGPAMIEDLPQRFFCVSANLTTAEEVIHERGPLWPAVRASLSLPGIFPPVYADGHLLIDGGALDNVPVEVMRARVGNGCVIAVDLSPEMEPMTAVPFGPGLSGWRRGRCPAWSTSSAGPPGCRRYATDVRRQAATSTCCCAPPSRGSALLTSKAVSRSLRPATGTLLMNWRNQGSPTA